MPTAISSSDSGVAKEVSGFLRVSVATVEVAIKQATAITRITTGVVEAAIRTTVNATPLVGNGDTGRGSEAWLLGYSVADSGSVVEAASAVIFLSLSDADIGTGDDSLAFPTWTFSDSDAGVAAEAASSTAAVATVENGSGNDGPSVQGTISAADVGSAVETAQEFIALAVTPTDSGAVVEAGLVTNFLAVASSDSGAAVETTGGRPLSTADVGTSVDSGGTTSTLTATDAGTQSAAYAVALASSDSATGADGQRRIMIADVSVAIGRTQSSSSNSFLQVTRDVTATLPRVSTVAATTTAVGIKDVQAQPSRVQHVSATAGVVTTAESSVLVANVRTVSFTTDGSDVLMPDPPTLQVTGAPSDPSGDAVAGGSVIVNVSLGEPFDTVQFFWDTSSTAALTASLDDSGNLIGASVLIPIHISTGVHTLTVSGIAFGTATMSFTIVSEVPAPTTETSTTPEPPPPPSQRWHLYDPYNQEQYLLPIGPSEIDAPYLGRNLVTAGTTNPAGGQKIVWEGGKTASMWTCSGRLVDGAQIDALRSWRGRPHRVWLYDPLGRAWLIKVTGVELTPVRDLAHEMTHDWVLHALIYGRKS